MSTVTPTNPFSSAMAKAFPDGCGARSLTGPFPFMVASTVDGCCAPAEHTDPYARELKARGIPCKYLRRDFGDHGFGLEGGWTEACVKWLRARGFGTRLPSDKGRKPAAA